MTEKEKRSLKIRLGKRLSQDKSRIMEIIKEEIDKTETTMEQPHGAWEYLKEHITDMCNADGESHLNQKQTCQFILNLMKVIEEEGDEK